MFTKKKINEEQLKILIEKINVFNNLYPVQFLKNIDDFNKNSNHYAISYQYPSNIFSPQMKTCLVCHNYLVESCSKLYTATVYYIFKPAGNTIKLSF